ncbi:hypothetical protein D9757_014224 [Collybiopsis confluens]|uniref:Uncharacterized protein n=1 Tax=Collybiopsis confluens TaxID=2823264 RepID=A0A8H5CYG3_9AGAR|nr:hypothetical protein D9757_014224 [Collybiopsis confluens]
MSALSSSGSPGKPPAKPLNLVTIRIDLLGPSAHSVSEIAGIPLKTGDNDNGNTPLRGSCSARPTDLVASPSSSSLSVESSEADKAIGIHAFSTAHTVLRAIQ